MEEIGPSMTDEREAHARSDYDNASLENDAVVLPPQSPADIAARTKEVVNAVSQDSTREQLDKIDQEATKRKLSPEEIRILKRDRVLRIMGQRQLTTRIITRY
jgi:hypothetical protein